MKSSTSYPIRVLATGFIVLMLLSIPLFWFRSLCRISLCERIPDDLKNALIEPSGFLARDIEQNPNLARMSRIIAAMRPECLLLKLGICDYFESISPGDRRSNVFVAKSQDNWAYFDKKSGQIVCRYDAAKMMPDQNKLYREVQYYVGPEGISEIPDHSLGRFIDPIIDHSWLDWGWRRERLHDLTLYDAKLKRFFRIDFDELTVLKSPEISTSDGHEPIQIGLLDKNPYLLDLNWSPPAIKISTNYRIGHGREYESIIETAHYGDIVSYLLVLDKSGGIHLLDKETLQLTGTVGQLPETKTLFGSERPVTPTNVLSYHVQPVFLGAFRSLEAMQDLAEQTPKNVPLRYAGMFAATLSRDGTALAITAVDDKGEMNRWVHATTKRHIPSEAAYFGSPWAPASTIGKYLAENLHPPILSLVSYFTASSFEAGSGHRALFLLPNSFIAMKGRDSRGNIAIQFLSALSLMIPSILLAIWLACQVAKDAAVVGFPQKTRCWWILGTIAFGLAGYITYKLTRPKVTLVTCANCGKSRRPDMDKCHRCNSLWHVPELTPPAWRILDNDIEKGDQDIRESG